MSNGYFQTGKTASAININRFNLPDSDFADEKDRIFPIFDKGHVMSALRVFANDYHQFLKPRYKKERLKHIHDRIINEAIRYEVSIKNHSSRCEICKGIDRSPEKVMFT